MGLDSVELVMDVEREFDIEIPDEDAANILTVGEFYDFVILSVAIREKLTTGFKA